MSVIPGSIVRRCEFSPDRKYRYTLWRDWCREYLMFEGDIKSRRWASYAMFIGLNPSTADETLDDPTIRRCVAFAKRWGYGALCMCNLYAYRETDPKVMLAQANPHGPENDYWVERMAANAGIIVAAWGANAAPGAARYMLEKLPGVYCLGENADGTPKHPLYIDGETKPYEYLAL